MGCHHCRLGSDSAAMLRCFWTAGGSGCGPTSLPRPQPGTSGGNVGTGVVVLGAGMGGASVIDGGGIPALRHGDGHTAHIVVIKGGAGRGRRGVLAE